MTEENPKATSMIRKDCTGCGQVFRGLPEVQLCTLCQYKQTPRGMDMRWTWKRAGRGRWRIAAYWPDREPLPNPGDQVTVYRKDGSSSTVTILEVEGLRYLPSGRGVLECIV